MQRSRFKKSLIFALPAVLITTTAPLASISCGGGKYSYLNDIKFKLINPSITTNKEIVEEFKKNKRSLKNYLEIVNPNKYDLQINDVEVVGNSAIKILIKTSQNGKNEYNAWTQPLSGLKDPSKTWEQKDLELLSKILLDQVKNKPKDLIDLQNSRISDMFPSTINPEMIKFKTSITELIAKKSPKFELVAKLDSNDDIKGSLSLSLELKTKNSKPRKISKNNITLSSNDGLLSLDDLASKLTVNDLNLPTDISELLPSKFEFEINNIFKKDSILKNDKYSNVAIKDISYENKEPDGIKIISFKLKHKGQLSKPINLSINKFYSTKQFDELCENLSTDDLDINIDSQLLPSNVDVNNIKLKSNSALLAKNPNIKIKEVQKSLADDINGNLTMNITLLDTKNNYKINKELTIGGFYSTNKFKELTNIFSQNDLDINIDSQLLPNNVDVNNIKLKSNSALLARNTNIKIKEVKKSLADDTNGNLTISITLLDIKNNYKINKELTIIGFYSTNKFNELVNSFSQNDLDINIDSQLLPSNVDVNNIKLKSNSALLANNPNIKIKEVLKSLADDTNGNLTMNITLLDTKNNYKISKELTISGFYSINKFKELVNSFSQNDLDINVDSQLLPSNVDVNNIKLKSNSALLVKNPNLKMKIVPNSIQTNDGDGILRFKILLFDAKNANPNLSIEKEIKMEGWKHLNFTSAELDKFVDQIVENNKNHKVYTGAEHNFEKEAKVWNDIYVINETGGKINKYLLDITNNDFKIKSTILLNNRISLSYVKWGETTFKPMDKFFIMEAGCNFKLKSHYSTYSSKTLVLNIRCIWYGPGDYASFSTYGSVRSV
ncbi:lipoprotein 17-related variable surface protein [Mycoplasmopsis primatum]|uniref:lipoprotein 17-related variable surface protein n=1 Tax=Mycoplasmopsis primatum TaxID=55604 RepID=UPI000496E308|nr:lipoprotein 17-related variable surface protein [Mycoplasmopsis primatum]